MDTAVYIAKVVGRDPVCECTHISILLGGKNASDGK